MAYRGALLIPALVLLQALACNSSSPKSDNPQLPGDGATADGSVGEQQSQNCSPGVDLFVAPTGGGTDCSCRNPCSLEAARDRARSLAPSLTRDLVVEIAGGTYTLRAPFVLGTADSGQGGRAIVYRAAPGQKPILSGGLRVSGFTPSAEQVRVAPVPPGTQSRQLYVNGRRATRARGAEKPAGYTLGATGFSLGDSAILTWPDRDQLEVVGFKEWKSFRCGVEKTTAAQGLVLEQPCFGYSQEHAGYTFDSVQWLENARELLDEPGEFYLDSAAGKLYYWPLPEDDLATAEVILPVAEQLLRIEGTPAAPVHDLRIEGVTFAYATWNGPSTKDGYAPIQAGVSKRGPNGEYQKPPAHVTLHAAQRVELLDSTFTHLGAAALALEVGARQNAIRRCRFEDVSGGGVLVGDVTHVDDHHPSDPALIVQDNTVSGCYVTRTSAEYFDQVALFAGYTTRTTFEENEVFDVPYTAISLGWGWGSVDPGGSDGYTTPTTSHHNVVRNNRISHHVRRLRDGGAIYVLGAQSGSVMQANVIGDQGYLYGNLYLDNGSQGWSVTGNLVDVPVKENGTGVERSYWIYVQVYPTLATNNTVGINFTNDALLFTPSPIDPSNTLATPQPETNAPAGLATAGSPLRSPNVARGKPSSASSTYDEGHPAAAANNGNAYDGWSPAGDDKAAFWQVDLGTRYSIDAVEVVSRWGFDQPVTRKNYRVRAGLDSALKDGVEIGRVGATALPHRTIYASTLRAPVVARYVRVEKTQPEYFFIAEVLVHGKSSP